MVLLSCFQLEGSIDQEYRNPITYRSWKGIAKERAKDQDIVYLRNGSVLKGTLETELAVNYPFTTVRFEPGEVTLFAFGRGSCGNKVQAITFDGRNYVGEADMLTVVFVEDAPVRLDQCGIATNEPAPGCQCNPCTCNPCLCGMPQQQGSYAVPKSHYLNLSDINYIVLREGQKVCTKGNGEGVALRLTNGDELPVQICGNINVNTGNYSMSVQPKGTIEMSLSGGRQKTYHYRDSLPRNFDRVTVEDEILNVKVGAEKAIFGLPWTSISGIKGSCFWE